MSSVIIIGAGGVGNVVAHKCAKNKDIFSRIILASRTLSKCKKIKDSIKDSSIEIDTVDADKTSDVISIIKKYNPDLIIHVALPYQDLSIMDACLETGTNYLDTANYEPKEEAKFEYKWQWAYQNKFQEKGILALLGSGFDPGVTNVFCAYAQKHFFDEIHFIDILDCNGGDHGYPFATNFNPEINIREITSKGKFWENGQWIETDPLSAHQTYDFPEVGPKEAYLMYHEELESLVQNIHGLKRIRFWMTFSEKYLTHLKVLENVGMTSINPIHHQGKEIIPIQFLKELLPDPASLGKRTQGKTNIGCVLEGIKDGQKKKIYIYNVCDHQECYQEVQSQAISYTTGVPAMIGAKMILTKKWNGCGVYNMEKFDPDPFMEELNKQGLPWILKDIS